MDIKKWSPNSLYESALTVVSDYFEILKDDLRELSPLVYFDTLYKLYHKGCTVTLDTELGDFDRFVRILSSLKCSTALHKCFQALMNRAYDTDRPGIASVLASSYSSLCNNLRSYKDIYTLASRGLALSTFLSEAGWLLEAEYILMSLLNLLSLKDSKDIILLDCYYRLLHVQNANWKFVVAKETYHQIVHLLNSVKDISFKVNLASIYSEFSIFYMLQCNYDEAYSWSVKAIKELNESNSSSIVDVLKQAAKACVFKRELKKAGLLIKQAVKISHSLYGDEHHKFASVLIIYGFYLLHIDAPNHAVDMYKKALDIRQSIFEGINLTLAIAHEDLAYASYVHNYTWGTFLHARYHSERALEIMEQILPSDHLLFSSNKRVKALILEELAVDNIDKDTERLYLEDAHALHQEALKLTMKAFGEMNIQTAKHLGNLGRLYQSMKLFEKAEEMHLKSIYIKEHLLGPDDYEVSLSVGHLASLYNYDMMKYDEAERLYLRSIKIGKKLFGESYSGLEYDYRGLLRVYDMKAEKLKKIEYQCQLLDWKSLRNKLKMEQTSPLSDAVFSLDLANTLEEFFCL